MSGTRREAAVTDSQLVVAFKGLLQSGDADGPARARATAGLTR